MPPITFLEKDVCITFKPNKLFLFMMRTLKRARNITCCKVIKLCFSFLWFSVVQSTDSTSTLLFSREVLQYLCLLKYTVSEGREEESDMTVFAHKPKLVRLLTLEQTMKNYWKA